MHFQIVSARTGRVRQFDLTENRTLMIGAAATLLLVTAIFFSGIQLGRFIAGPLQGEQLARELQEQRMAIDGARQQVQGKVDALAKRVGTLNAHLIRLDALGRRVTDLADLDRGEFDFDAPPPTGGPEGGEIDGGSAAVPELAATLDALELQLQDREGQLVVLENLMAMRELGERIIPGGLPLIGGWISSHYGYRSDPFTGHRALHRGVDFAGRPGTRIVSVAPGVVSYAGYKPGYGYVVEITHPTGYLTRYGHNSRNLVRSGQMVQKG
ncbi:MAG TPA: M23 family metallopeptidase, partial [Steroidobacteraceae bacterium]|nr:M23 family metallopeptidase [Steroidobacteraceae bacterium]